MLRHLVPKQIRVKSASIWDRLPRRVLGSFSCGLSTKNETKKWPPGWGAAAALPFILRIRDAAARADRIA